MLLPMLVIYQEYVRNHHFSLQVLAECKQKEKFNSILKRLEEKAVLQQRSLEIFLTYPMHQVRPAYALRKAISRGLVINEFPNLRIIYLFSFRIAFRPGTEIYRHSPRTARPYSAQPRRTCLTGASQKQIGGIVKGNVYHRL